MQQQTRQQLELARLAAQGERAAQREVNAIAQPLIDFQNNRLCKRYCRDHRYRYRCSLSQPLGGAPEDAPLCEWGNAGYAWMLDDLCKPERLLRYEGRNQASLFDYFYSIANSLPFYERWKDWRFGRRLQLPTYIRELGEQAGAVFYALRGGQTPAQIAATLKLDPDRTEALIHEIVLQLTRRHRLYLLDPPREVSLTVVGGTDDDSAHQLDIAVDDDEAELEQQREQLNRAWAGLDPVEQFVLEAMIIEEQAAEDVLEALKTLDISIKAGVDAAATDRQQLYYFKRKALAKLGLELERS